MTAASVHAEAREALVKQIPLGRIGRPEEVAEVVAFLVMCGNSIALILHEVRQ